MNKIRIVIIDDKPTSIKSAKAALINIPGIGDGAEQERIAKAEELYDIVVYTIPGVFISDFLRPVKSAFEGDIYIIDSDFSEINIREFEEKKKDYHYQNLNWETETSTNRGKDVFDLLYNKKKESVKIIYTLFKNSPLVGGWIDGVNLKDDLCFSLSKFPTDESSSLRLNLGRYLKMRINKFIEKDTYNKNDEIIKYLSDANNSYWEHSFFVGWYEFSWNAEKCIIVQKIDTHLLVNDVKNIISTKLIKTKYNGILSSLIREKYYFKYFDRNEQTLWDEEYVNKNATQMINDTIDIVKRGRTNNIQFYKFPNLKADIAKLTQFESLLDDMKIYFIFLRYFCTISKLIQEGKLNIQELEKKLWEDYEHLKIKTDSSSKNVRGYTTNSKGDILFRFPHVPYHIEEFVENYQMP